MYKSECVIGSQEHVLEVCQQALALAGYKILDADEDCVFIKLNCESYEIKVFESH